MSRRSVLSSELGPLTEREAEQLADIIAAVAPGAGAEELAEGLRFWPVERWPAVCAIHADLRAEELCYVLLTDLDETTLEPPAGRADGAIWWAVYREEIRDSLRAVGGGTLHGIRRDLRRACEEAAEAAFIMTVDMAQAGGLGRVRRARRNTRGEP